MTRQQDCPIIPARPSYKNTGITLKVTAYVGYNRPVRTHRLQCYVAKILEIGKGCYKISEHSAEIGVKEQQEGWKLFVHNKHCDIVPLTTAELEKMKNIRERFHCMTFLNLILGHKKPRREFR